MFFKKKKTVMQEPEIVEFDESIKAVGISVDTDSKNANKDISKLGKEFAHIKANIVHKDQPWRFIAASKNFNRKTGTFTYFMGDVVTSFEGQPEDLEQYEVPKIMYAKLTIKPKNKLSWGLEIIKMKKYFYSEWLPKSKYKQAKTVDEIEMHDDRSRAKKPEMDMYFAIKKKK